MRPTRVALGTALDFLAYTSGAMLMNIEISTVVQRGAPVAWSALNDARYIAAGLCQIGFEVVGRALPGPDFAAIARAQEADGFRGTTETELLPALERVLRAEGRFALEVLVGPGGEAPSAKRNKCVISQASTTQGGAP